ncbi:MAG: T9SS type A sorting domain-containing protein [Fibrobacteria bacterium]|nr:T9SS type A sorting domain-containing protein [Fibrobacteria bacterium]
MKSIEIPSKLLNKQISCCYHNALFVLFSFLVLLTATYSQGTEESPFGFCPAVVNIDGYLKGYADAQNIGVTWTRPTIYAFWAVVQRDLKDTTLDFKSYDNTFGNVPVGMHIMGNISAAPAMGNFTDYLSPGSYFPTDSVQYIRFVKKLIDRYNGDGINDMPGLITPIKYWQVGNEPNTRKTDFAGLQRITFTAAKEVDTSVSILLGGVPGFPGDYIKYFDETYEPMLTELDGGYFDILDFHWYGTAYGDYRLKDSKTGKDVLEHIQSSLKSHGYAENLPIWISEMGAYSGSPGNLLALNFLPQTERQQAFDYLKRHVYPLARGVKKIFPGYGIMEGFKQEDGYFDHTGLIYDGKQSGDLGLGVKKLGYYAYKLMTEKLKGSDWDSIETIIDGVNNVYCYGFKKKSGKIVRVLWWDYFQDLSYTEGDTALVTLSVPDMDSVLITSAVPDAENGSELVDKDYPDFFLKETKPVTGNTVDIVLGIDPVFIENGSPFSVPVTRNSQGLSLSMVLEQNYPNPFNQKTLIGFNLKSDDRISLEVFDITGKMITALINNQLYSAGHYEVKWETMYLPSGIYYYRLSSKTFSETRKARLFR